MPALVDLLARRAGIALEDVEAVETTVQNLMTDTVNILERRINIPLNSSSPPGLVEADTRDPWNKSGKYALGWVYFCIILMILTIIVRCYNLWTDKVRTALYKEDVATKANTASLEPEQAISALSTDNSTHEFFPQSEPSPEPSSLESDVHSNVLVNSTIAVARFIFYRPLPVLHFQTRWKLRPLVFPSLSVIAITSAALIFTVLYCFVPQPLYWQSIQFGSPPLAIRAGMIAVAMIPWIVALSMKANIISFLTGIGHERLNALHRWLAYLCLLLSLIHTIPFYVTPIWDQGALQVFKSMFNQGFYVYGTGIAALVPLLLLCIHSLPLFRASMYELFVIIHVPVSIVFLGMLFWHCHNYLTSWNYLWATTAIWFLSYAVRLLFLNWTNPWRLSWLVGEEAAITVMPENALKITIPTQMKWKPGQYVYLRMPGISVFDSHPFTIASLCSDDFPSACGEEYRDMVLVFRPYGGFTKRVLNRTMADGPWNTYRAFLDGPYGGMARRMDAFDQVVLFAGGSGITALVSQLLDLIKRMRDGKAVTKTVHVIWALKRPETMEWFREELRICREFAPANSVQCHFYITTAKRQAETGLLVSAQTPSRPLSQMFYEKVNDVFQSIANHRLSGVSSTRNSRMIAEEADGDAEQEKELRLENEDHTRPLPEAHLLPARSTSRGHLAPPVPATHPSLAVPQPTLHEKRRSKRLALDVSSAQTIRPTPTQQALAPNNRNSFNFGFPTSPTEFQKNLMRFAFLPSTLGTKKTGWSTEYGRPDIPFMLKDMSREWTGRRICVYVCGPPSMRVDVSNTVAELQRTVWGSKTRDEVFLHTENYAI